MRNPRAQALGHGSVAIAGDNYAPITTNTFVGKWYGLADAVQRWGTYIDGKLGSDFHDRESLANEVSALVFGDTGDRGFFLLEADAGMGKTTFAAWLSHHGGYPTHFTQLNPDARHQSTAIRSLTAQLIAAWDLTDLAPGGLLPSASDTPDWFARVIASAAERRDALAAERGGDAAASPIVLVVDALDASLSLPDGHLPLGLPWDLPRGVYIVATARTGAVRHLPTDTRVRRISGRDEVNLADLRGHLESQASQPWLTSALAAAGIPGAQFVDTVVERSRGVWIYVHYVLEDLKRDPGLARQLPQLPKGLDAYYHDNLLPLCDGDQARVILPLLGTLAVASEPLDARTLAILSGLPSAADVTAVDQALNGVLRPFCSARSVTVDDGHIRLFEALHPSLGEYLSSGPDPEAAGADSHKRLLELSVRSCREAQHRICDRYLSLWGGLSTGVPALAADPAVLEADRGYAVRWLVTHLETAGRSDDIHRLLAAEHGDRNVWYQCHDVSGDLTAYLHDVERAKRLAPDRGEWLRYRLIEAGIASMSVVVPPNILEQLVERGLWTLDRAFSLLERASDKGIHSGTLKRMIPRLPVDLLGRALSLAAQLRDHDERAAALCALIPRLPEDLLPAAVPAIASFPTEGTIAQPLAALVARLPLDRVRELWDMSVDGYPGRPVNQYVDMFLRILSSEDRRSGGLLALQTAKAERRIDDAVYLRLIGALIPYLPSETFDAVLAAVHDSNMRYVDGALGELMTHAPDDKLGDVFTLVDKLREVGGWLAGADRARLTEILLSRTDGVVPDTHLEFILTKLGPRHLVSVVPRLDDRQVRDLISRLDTLNRAYIRDVYATLMNALAQRLSEAEGVQLITARFGDQPRQNRMGYEYLDETVIAPLAGWYSEDARNTLVKNICGKMGMRRSRHQDQALLEQLAPHLTEQQLNNVFSLVMQETVLNTEARLATADVLAPFLNDDGLRTALRHCTGFALEEQSFAAIAALTPRLPSRDYEAAVLDALTMAEGIRYERHKVRAIVNLAPAVPESLCMEAWELIASVDFRLWMAIGFESIVPLLTPDQLVRSYEAVGRGNGLGGLLDDATKAMPSILTRLGREHPARVDQLIHDLFADFGDPPSRGNTAFAMWPVPWHYNLTALAPFLAPEQARLAWNLIGQTNYWKLFGHTDSRTVEVRARLAARFDENDRAAAVDSLLTGWVWEEWLETYSHTNTETIARTLAALGNAAMTPQLEAAYLSFWRHTPRDSEAFKVLSIFKGTIPRSMSGPALDFAVQGDWNHLNFRALRHIGGCLNDADRERVIHHLTNPDERHNLDAIAAMLPHVAADRRPELIALAIDNPSPWIELATITNLVRYAVGDQRRIFVGIALDLSTLRHPWWENDEWPNLLRQLSANELRELYARSAQMHIRKSPTTAQAAILTELGNRPRQDRSPPGWDPTTVWPTVIDRGELFTLIAASAWWINDTSGRSGTARMLTTVFDVARWWP